jgi:hypothetical protein
MREMRNQFEKRKVLIDTISKEFIYMLNDLIRFSFINSAYMYYRIYVLI